MAAENAGKIQKYKNAIKRLRDERNQALQFAADVEVERDARPTTEQLAEVTGKLRGDRHRAAFDRAAAKAKIRPEALNDAWELAKIKADTDEPDEGKIASTISDMVKQRSYLLAPDEDGKEKTRSNKEKLPPGEGAGAGSADKSVGGFTVTEAQARDSAWMAQNQAAIAEHSQAGTIRWM